VRRTVPPSAEIAEQIDRLLAVGVGENPRESLSALAKLGAKLIIQRAVEEEFDAWLGRARYERRPDYQRGLRNGFRPRKVQTLEGELRWRSPGQPDDEDPRAGVERPRQRVEVRERPPSQAGRRPFARHAPRPAVDPADALDSRRPRIIEMSSGSRHGPAKAGATMSAIESTRTFSTAWRWPATSSRRSSPAPGWPGGGGPRPGRAEPRRGRSGRARPPDRPVRRGRRVSRGRSGLQPANGDCSARSVASASGAPPINRTQVSLGARSPAGPTRRRPAVSPYPGSRRRPPDGQYPSRRMTSTATSSVGRRPGSRAACDRGARRSRPRWSPAARLLTAPRRMASRARRGEGRRDAPRPRRRPQRSRRGRDRGAWSVVAQLASA
jgi:Transposase, Mutator family